MKLPTIDLFAGAGGLSLGLEAAGLCASLAVEQDRWAAETFQANFPRTRVITQDIETVNEEEIIGFASFSPVAIVGGPPCQGFSHSNVVNRDPSDPRNSLFRQFLRWVNIIRPPFFLLENVSGLSKTRMQDGDFARNVMTREIEAAGYVCDWAVLQAADFGVPQRRERLFVIGARSPSLLSGFSWPTAGAGSTVSLWDAISDLPELPGSYTSPPLNAYQELARAGVTGSSPTAHEPMRHTARIVERFRAIGFGEGETSVDLRHQPLGRGGGRPGRPYGQNSRRQRPDAPSNTIVASSHTNFIHPFYHRNFTVRELMRLQSFPDTFVVKGKRAVLSKKLSERKGLLDEVFLDQRMQIGNAVPPLLATAIGRQLALAISASTVARHAA